MKKISKNKFSEEELKQNGWWAYKKGGWWTNGFGIILDIKFGGVYKNNTLVKKINNLEECMSI